MITQSDILSIIESIDTNEEKAKKIYYLINKPTIASEKIDFDRLLEWFNKVTRKNIRTINHKTKAQLNARLRDGYSKSDIMKAVINCHNDKFHIENPQYLTLEFITRPDKLEKYLYAGANSPQVQLPSDWYSRELTDAQQSLLTDEQYSSWERNKKAILMDGGKIKPIKV